MASGQLPALTTDNWQLATANCQQVTPSPCHLVTLSAVGPMGVAWRGPGGRDGPARRKAAGRVGDVERDDGVTR